MHPVCSYGLLPSQLPQEQFLISTPCLQERKGSPVYKNIHNYYTKRVKPSRSHAKLNVVETAISTSIAM